MSLPIFYWLFKELAGEPSLGTHLDRVEASIDALRDDVLPKVAMIRDDNDTLRWVSIVHNVPVPASIAKYYEVYGTTVTTSPWLLLALFAIAMLFGVAVATIGARLFTKAEDEAKKTISNQLVEINQSILKMQSQYLQMQVDNQKMLATFSSRLDSLVEDFNKQRLASAAAAAAHLTPAASSPPASDNKVAEPEPAPAPAAKAAEEPPASTDAPVVKEDDLDKPGTPPAEEASASTDAAVVDEDDLYTPGTPPAGEPSASTDAAVVIEDDLYTPGTPPAKKEEVSTPLSSFVHEDEAAATTLPPSPPVQTDGEATTTTIDPDVDPAVIPAEPAAAEAAETSADAPAEPAVAVAPVDIQVDAPANDAADDATEVDVKSDVQPAATGPAAANAGADLPKVSTSADTSNAADAQAKGKAKATLVSQWAAGPSTTPAATTTPTTGMSGSRFASAPANAPTGPRVGRGGFVQPSRSNRRPTQADRAAAAAVEARKKWLDVGGPEEGSIKKLLDQVVASSEAEPVGIFCQKCKTRAFDNSYAGQLTPGCPKKKGGVQCGHKLWYTCKVDHAWGSWGKGKAR